MKKDKILAPFGLILIGAGFCIAVEAAILKSQEASLLQWIAMGTAGLIIMNAGISVFGDAVKHATLRAWREGK
jgi:hypothetical protein